MDRIYTGLVSLAVAMLAFVLQSLLRENRRLKKEKDDAMKSRDKALEKGVVCLLRKALMEDYSETTQRSSITAYEYENWIEMYNAYLALGGNGMVKHMKDVIEDLKMKSGW